MDSSTPQLDPCFTPRAAHTAQAAPAAPSPPVLLLADDLTGACDASVGFVHQGFTASVLLQDASAEQPPSTDVLASVTFTRGLSPEAARQKLLIHPLLRSFSGATIFHKVDSAGRGNPGVEMMTIAEQTGRDIILYAPAFPAAGRVVRNGQLHIADFSERNRVVDLFALVPPELRTRVEWIKIQSLESLRRTMMDANSAGRNLWICDAASEQDLDGLVGAVSGLSVRPLWSGSAGLAAAVARQCFVPHFGQTAKRSQTPRPGRTLVISGTEHAVTLAQFEHLAQSSVCLSLDAKVLPEFTCGCLQIDWAQVTPDAVRRFWQRLHNADQPPIASLLLTGGDTAAFVLEALGASSLRLGGELEPGIPWSLAVGGMVDGVLVVTKSGSFGIIDSLARCAELSQRMMG